MAIVEYVRALGEGARKRHQHETRRGNVVAFVVQLEVELRGAWVPVIRYDMAHGQAHIDVYETPKRKRKQFLPAQLDLKLNHERDNVAATRFVLMTLTLAEEDIKDNWEQYQAEFLRRNRR